MNFYPFHLGDYAAHTRHLSLLEDLAYRRMIDLYYTTESPLPLEIERIARLIGMRDHIQEVSDVVSDFFVRSEAGYINGRCDKEIEAYKAKAERAKAANKARWGAEKSDLDAKSDVKSEADQIPTNNQEPLTNKKKKETTPPAARVASLSVADLESLDVENQTAVEFLAIRKRKRAPLTELAMDGIRREAENAGWTINAVLKKCIERGWQSFEAGWVAGNVRAGAIPINKQEALEAKNRQVGEAWAARMQGDGQ